MCIIKKKVNNNFEYFVNDVHMLNIKLTKTKFHGTKFSQKMWVWTLGKHVIQKSILIER